MAVNNSSNGAVLQYVRVQTSTPAALSNGIPIDTSIPQITEGNLILSLPITPISNNSILLVEFNTNMSQGTIMGGNTTFNFCLALFRDANPNAIDSLLIPGRIMEVGGVAMQLPSFTHKTLSGSTAPTVFSVRAGKDSTADAKYRLVYNASGSSAGTGIGPQLLGGTDVTSLTVTEIQINI